MERQMRLILSISAVALMVACASTPASDTLGLTRNGETFSGSAGVDWTDAELRSNALGALCPAGQKVTDLQITRTDGIADFTGRCV